MSALRDGVTDLGLTGRDFLTIHDYAPAEIAGLLDLAAELKAAQKRAEPHPLLAGKAVGMIFTKTSTRTRISFEVGIAQLGAQPLFLNANDIQLRVGETMKDTGHVLSRYLDGHHDPHVRPGRRGRPGGERDHPHHQRADRRPSPLPGDGRRAHRQGALPALSRAASSSTRATATTWPIRSPKSAPRPACAS